MELSREHLEENSDRDRQAAILLGFHGVTSLLKTAATAREFR